MMSSIFRALIFFYTTSLLFVMSVAAQAIAATHIERELDYLMAIWPGDYDNQEQVSFDARAKDQKEIDQARFHSLVEKVDFTALGDHVLYIEERLDDDIQRVHFRRLYVLSADETEKAVRVISYVLKNAADFELENLSALNAEDLSLQQGCDMLLRRNGDGFKGQMKSGECDDSEGAGYRDRRVRIFKEHYSFKDQRIDSDGRVINSVANFSWRELQRARWFACMIDVPKDTPGLSNFTQHYIKIHDQGGSFKFAHPDGRNMTLLMRNTWSYGMRRETFFIGVFEGSVTDKLLVYSWGEPGADRIGMNPGYIRIQCDLDTPRNVELQKALRPDS